MDDLALAESARLIPRRSTYAGPARRVPQGTKKCPSISILVALTRARNCPTTGVTLHTYLGIVSFGGWS